MCKPLLLFAALLLCLPVSCFAQQSMQPAASSPAKTPARDGLIRLNVVVTDKSGDSISGLESKSFTLVDHGQTRNDFSVQAVRQGSAPLDSPVTVILIIDTVNLPTHQAAAEKSEAEKFLRENGGRLAQPVSLFLLSLDGLSSTSAPTTDGNALAEELAHGDKLPVMRQSAAFHAGQGYASGGTMTLGAAANRNSLRALAAIAIEERRHPRRKLMFWMGPGWPVDVEGWDNSFNTVTELSTRLREARIALWSATEWPDPNRNFVYQDYLDPIQTAAKIRPGNLALNVLATQSGGGVLSTGGGLAGLIERCIEASSTYYVLTFDPSPTTEVDAYHDLKVGVDKPGVTIRTSMGYYDEPVYHDQPAQADPVTVAQLEQMLGASPGRGDKESAQQLARVALTERFSSARLSRWKARLRGDKSRAALVALADQSIFLAPPAAEIATTAPPDEAMRRLMLSKAIDYLNKTLVRLPNFFATRTTVQYDELPLKDEQTWKTATSDQSLHATGTAKATVLFRDGKETLDGRAGKGKPVQMRERDLDTQGTFGPILAMVFQGAAAVGSEFIWSHWEQGTAGPTAVFRYAIPQGISQFKVGFCCLADPDGTIVFEKKAACHGEVAIDPETGAILRLTVDADLEPRSPMVTSGILVEYGPVEIGGQTYICPTRSVTISRQRTVRILEEWGERFGVYGRFETILSDVTFGGYHVFRADSRIVTDDTATPK